MGYEKLSEKEQKWLLRKKKRRIWLMTCSSLLFIFGFFSMGACPSLFDDPIQKEQASFAAFFLVALSLGSLGALKEEDKFLKIIDKMKE
mgnify:CR=1 FL=1